MGVNEDDVVLCTVTKIESTTVFVNIEGNGSGSIVLSEIAAGRIRNLREYVSPNKKIVCKVLKVYPDHAELTLRRVTGKERDAVLEIYKKEQTFKRILSALEVSPEKIINDIKQDFEIPEFLEEAKENREILQKYFTKEQAEKLSKMLEEKVEKQKTIKKIFTLSSNSPDGIKSLKEILSSTPLSRSYLGSSKFSISSSAKDFKTAEKAISQALEEIEKKAKEKKVHFELKEKQ